MLNSENNSSRLESVSVLIDKANAEDPNSETIDGKPIPKELLYGHRMSQWLERLYPEASDNLKIAVRAQHLRRWKIPRDSYPMNKESYLRWRKDLARFHGEQLSELMEECNYSAEEIKRVISIVKKEKLKLDAESQALEDCACLVFIDYYLAEFVPKHTEEKIIDILQKTWKKMSPQAHEAALGLTFPDDTLLLIQKALA